MFGKRAKNQSQDQDFDESEAGYADDFASQDQNDEAGWGDEQAESDEAIEPELRDRRRSPLAKVLPFAAIGVLAAGGAGYYYLNFMQAPSANPVIAAAPSEPAAAEPTAAVAADPIYATAPADITATEATAETAIPSLPSSPETAMFEPADALVETGVQETAENIAAAPDDIQQDPVLAAEPVEDVPADLPSQIAATEELAVPEQTTPAPAVTAPVTTPPAATQSATPLAPLPAATVASENIADISGRIDVLEHQIEDLTKAVDRLASQGTTANSAAVVDAELRKTVTALQEQVRKLQSDLTSSVRAGASTSTGRSTTTTTDPAPARPAAAASPATRPAAATNTRPAAAAPAPVRWVLRAAQSNEAWVSRSSEGELRSVTVGQSLEGIGRVTAIRQGSSGGWEVIGTQGSLRQ